MNKRRTEYLKFNKKDREKFLNEVIKLSCRARNILESEKIESYDSFYYRLFVQSNPYDFTRTRNSGVKTRAEIINLMRTILNTGGKYNKELEKYDAEMSKLSPRARSAIINMGLSLFETFYYKYVIKKETIMIAEVRNVGIKTRPELYSFITNFGNYLGVDVTEKKPKILFNTKNPGIPFIPDTKTKKLFLKEFNSLSASTRFKLCDMGADSLYGFYLEIISEKSQFNLVLNKYGEKNLLEILRFRTLLNDSIKEIKNQ